MSNQPDHEPDTEAPDDAVGDDVEVDLGLGDDSDEPEVEIDFGDEDDSDEPEVEIDFGDDLKPSSSADDEIELNLDFSSDAEAPAADTEDDTELNLDFAEEPEEADDEEDEADRAADDAAAKALEGLREDLRSKFGEWYVIHTYSGMENRVQQNLENRVTSLNMEDYIFEVKVPVEEITELRNGVKKNIKRTVLPGYVLVRMDLTDESWATVRHTPSVTGFVGHSNQPIPLSLEEVEKMLAPAVIAAATAEISPSSRPRKKKNIEVADFTEGDSVMVVEGPFAGVHATITEINVSSQRLKALVEILGRETPVDLTFAQIQKV